MSSKKLSFWGRKVADRLPNKLRISLSDREHAPWPLWLSLPIYEVAGLLWRPSTHGKGHMTRLVPLSLCTLRCGVPGVLDGPLEGGQGRLAVSTGWRHLMSHLPPPLRVLRNTTVLWHTQHLSFKRHWTWRNSCFTVILMDLWNTHANCDGASPGCALGSLPFPSNPDTGLGSQEVLNIKTCRQSRIAAIAKL